MNRRAGSVGGRGRGGASALEECPALRESPPGRLGAAKGEDSLTAARGDPEGGEHMGRK